MLHSFEEQMRAAQKLIEGARDILIVTHAKPDADGIGSALSLSFWIETLGKSYEIFCQDAVPRQLQFLPFAEKIQTDPSLFDKDRDLLIVLDSGDLRYAGIESYLEKLRGSIPIINIDHHLSNTQFGTVNAVESNASSACEMIWKFFHSINFQYQREVATCLLVGIVSDTSNFSNPATTFDSLLASSELLKKGGRFPAILQSTLQNKTVSSLRLWGRILGRLEQNEKYGVAVTVIQHEDVKEYQEEFETLNGISNFLNNLTGAKFVLVLKELEKGVIKGSLRTTRNDIDVSKIAEIFGGGGHCRAAGFSLSGEIIRMESGWKVL